MRKRFMIVIFIFSCFLLSSACSQIKEEPITEERQEVSFQGDILETHDNYLLISPFEEEPERKSADRITVSLQEAELVDESEQHITADKFEKGMKVEIVYDGMIAESYPAQILTCYKIRLFND